MDLGVRVAGFTMLASIERDPYCCESLQANVPDSSTKPLILETDIRHIAPLDVAKKVRLEIGTLDLLFGGPPCQTFSQIGKQQGLADERGLLLFEMIRFAQDLKPKVILIE